MTRLAFKILVFILALSCGTPSKSSFPEKVKKEYKAHTIAFYNVENLFDLENDPNTVYHGSTLRGQSFYTEDVYNAKLKNLSKVIAAIGRDFTGTTPSIVGLAEVENFNVINDLVNQDALIESEYSIVHYDSPDLRGIDLGLIYKKSVFIPTSSNYHRLKLFDIENIFRKTHTRDQLVVSGILEEELVYLIVHHWPSQSAGKRKSTSHRIKAGELNRKIVDSIFTLDPNAKIINMGDFNDDPINPSIKETLFTSGSSKDMKTTDMYNPMEPMFRKGLGTLAWRDSWSLFDQIMVSSELVKKDFSSLRFYQAGIFNPPYLTISYGKFKGYPYRSYSSEGWTGGYSDHFPVFIYLIKEREIPNKKQLP